MWDRVIYAFWANRIFWPVGTHWDRRCHSPICLVFSDPANPLKPTFTSKGRVFTNRFKLGGIVDYTIHKLYTWGIGKSLRAMFFERQIYPSPNGSLRSTSVCNALIASKSRIKF